MKRSAFSMLLGFLLIASPAFSNKNQPIGARSSAMANSSVGLSDLWSVHHNQAGLARINKAEAGIYYENRFLIPELSLKGFAVALPAKSGVFGVSVSHFGFALYSETQAGLAYAQKLGEKVSAGVKLNYLNTFIGDNYGRRGVMTAEVGVQAELAPGLTLGAHIYNPARARLSHYDNERVPTIMRLGLTYQVNEKALITAETQKDTDNKAVIKAGMEYRVVEQLYLRAGIATNPAMNTFGFGIYHKQFKIDFASSIHSVLGYSPMVSIQYAF
jgi:hypothetical protein